MRHKKAKYKLNRFTSWRKSTLNSLARSVLIYQSIKTTKTKARAVKPLIEQLITMGKENSLAAKRRAYAVLCDHKLVSLLFSDIAPRFSKRQGGYTRLLALGKRRGDNAEMALLELTEIKKKEPKKIKKEKEHAVKDKEAPTQETKKQEPTKEERPKEEHRPKADVKAPPKKFLGGFKNIFKKERDSL